MNPVAPPLDAARIRQIIDLLRDAGWADEDIRWSESVKGPANPEAFASETIFVICNSGMRFTVARKIYDRIMPALLEGRSAHAEFRHKGKASAIDLIWKDRQALFYGYLAAEDKLAFCRALPWIGTTTQYHLAKNFGVDVAKPDVHLQRLGDLYGKSPHDLCRELAHAVGLRVATIDLILWRACATGLLDPRTGELGTAARVLPESEQQQKQMEGV